MTQLIYMYNKLYIRMYNNKMFLKQLGSKEVYNQAYY